ncbi:pyridoxamine 5'-phosphate oxidase family protein [Aureimonas sp. Leaf324]|jgi:general stress protein 26|uniref:pyridoxamine 5'-phosphate oxidase family protein n=1 Tax=Aureimonas sp. Leaf324 TaxID=1736336 RepID=UPI0006FD9CDD|nr:pyridoxamine 5'-phosphate oxidase family protein [Aureimonas sp. Leaf324]KQQ79458.1 pyridoxamine 5'-phosphate oxidase [Aureimonas sp. Leaf324]
MVEMTLKDISEAMADIDFCMLSTRTEGGDIAARPMSNNGDVAYEGDSYFFTYAEARTVSDIERDPRVGLGFQGKKGLLGRPPMFISVEGRAELIRDKAAFEAHWTKDLEYWFKDGVDTPNLVLIKVHATRIHFWNGEDEGEVPVR